MCSTTCCPKSCDNLYKWEPATFYKISVHHQLLFNIWPSTTLCLTTYTGFLTVVTLLFNNTKVSYQWQFWRYLLEIFCSKKLSNDCVCLVYVYNVKSVGMNIPRKIRKQLPFHELWRNISFGFLNTKLIAYVLLKTW